MNAILGVRRCLESSITWWSISKCHLSTMPANRFIVRIHHVWLWNWLLWHSSHGYSHWISIERTWRCERDLMSVVRWMLTEFFCLLMTMRDWFMAHMLLWMHLWIMVVIRINHLVVVDSVSFNMRFVMSHSEVILLRSICLIHLSIGCISLHQFVLVVLHCLCTVRFKLILS